MQSATLASNVGKCSKESDYNVAANSLSQSVENLSSTIDGLEIRLSPVLLPSPPVCTDSVNKDPAVRPGTIIFLDKMTLLIRGLNDRIQDIEKRCCL
jgi:hypothetical protein